MIASVFRVLDALHPACAAFGPFFLVLGILARTSPRRETHPRAGLGFLIAGGVMITVCLLLLAPTGTPMRQ